MPFTHVLSMRFLFSKVNGIPKKISPKEKWVKPTFPYISPVQVALLAIIETSHNLINHYHVLFYQTFLHFDYDQKQPHRR